MRPILLFLGLGFVAMTAYNFVVPNAMGFTNARVLLWHLPCAFVCTFLLFGQAYLGVRYLMKRDLVWDAKLGACIELGVLFASLTMATGIWFSRFEWGAWWSWDPKQTSFLIVLFLMTAGLALRAGFPDDKRRAAVSSAYAVLTLLPALFLTFVFPRLKEIENRSLHPSQTLPKNQLDGNYWMGVLGTFVLLSVFTYVAYRMRAQVAILASRSDDNYGMEQSSVGGPTVARVVRPVGVSEDH